MREGNNAKQIYIEQPGRHNHFPTWSADGRFVYFARGPTPTEMDVWRIPATGGDAERLTQHSNVGSSHSSRRADPALHRAIETTAWGPACGRWTSSVVFRSR